VAGKDLDGNVYVEEVLKTGKEILQCTTLVVKNNNSNNNSNNSKATNGFIFLGALKRKVEAMAGSKPSDYNVNSIPPEWKSWLSFTREHGPSLEVPLVHSGLFFITDKRRSHWVFFDRNCRRAGITRGILLKRPKESMKRTNRCPKDIHHHQFD
jgi:hypothetical protein